MPAQLNIYKASAGSGKTFTLALEYLKILFSRPWAYKHILAVTFTNKATAEMKGRILNELFKIKQGEASDYIPLLTASTGKPEMQLRQEAGEILSTILHDYSNFSITNIDRFFLKVLRIFAKDIGIRGGQNIELDNDKVLDDATRDMLMGLEDNPQLKRWLTKIADNCVREGKGWAAYRSSFRKLGKELFKDTYRLEDNNDTSEELQQKLEKFIAKLHQIEIAFEKRMKEIGEKAITMMTLYSLDVIDFKYGKSSFANYFSKISRGDFEPGSRAVLACHDVKQWYGKSNTEKEGIEAFYHDGGNDLLCQAIELNTGEEFKQYNTTKTILKEIYNVGIIAYLRQQIRQYCQDNNIELLSNTSHFIKKIIGGSDTPFIYERLGNWYNCYMIDEFQDTSNIQWENFKPLIENSLARGMSNLLVGDVKQSIYRWRNSDWNLLHQAIYQDVPPSQCQEHALQTNYRSSPTVIDFNNTLFPQAVEQLQQQLNEQTKGSLPDIETKLQDIYRDVQQEYSPNTLKKTTGYVEISFAEPDEEQQLNAQEVILRKMASHIEQLQEAGYALKDIAVLVRKGAEGKMVANYLLQKKKETSRYQYDFISNDSLSLDYSTGVLLVITYLRLFIQDTPFHQRLAKHQRELLNLVELTPEQFNDIKKQSLYEQVFQLVRGLGINKIPAERVYTSCLLDAVREFEVRYAPQLSNFLDWWDETGHKKNIQSLEQDAIRIMTLHKSKGLEFKAVLIPFAHWSLEPDGFQQPVLWCHATQSPFSDFTPLPVKYQQGLEKTFFAEDYFTEKMQNYVDNLNLLYVAFTRAKESLWVCSKKWDKKTKTIGHVGNLLFLSSLQVGYMEDNDDGFTQGTLTTTSTSMLTTQETTLISGDFLPNEAVQPAFRTDFDELFEITDNQTAAKINQGTMWHEILANIKTPQDIEAAIRRLVISGRCTDQQAGEIQSKIEMLLNTPHGKSWFSDQWKIKPEQAILLPNGKKYRPDRVIIGTQKIIVIDYKTGEIEENTHIRQVKNYVRLIQQMNMVEQVEGFVWYLKTDKVVQV